MELIKIVENEFKCENLLEKVQDLVVRSKEEANKKVIKYLNDINDAYYPNIDLETIYRNQLPIYIYHKNKLIEKSENLLFGIYKLYNSDDEILIKKIIEMFFIKREMINSINEELTDIETTLTNIIYLTDVKNLPKGFMNLTDDEVVKSTIVRFEAFEQKYTDLLETENKRLIDCFFKEDYLFTKYPFKIGVVGMNLLYNFLKEANMIDSTINFGKFIYIINTTNKEKITISLVKSKFTEKHLGFLLWNLKKLSIYPKKKEYATWLNQKFTIISKNKKEKLIDMEYYDLYIREYKTELKSENIRYKKIQDFYKVVIRTA